MQHRFGRERGFIIRNANREAAALRVPPVFEGGARINDDAAPAAHLHWRRRHASDAVHVSLPYRPHLPRKRAAAAQPLLHRRPATTTPSVPRRAHSSPASCLSRPLTNTLVSDLKHLSHTATL